MSVEYHMVAKDAAHIVSQLRGKFAAKAKEHRDRAERYNRKRPKGVTIADVKASFAAATALEAECNFLDSLKVTISG